jgi:hypothetical protein
MTLYLDHKVQQTHYKSKGGNWETQSNPPGTGHSGGLPPLHGRHTGQLLGHIWCSWSLEDGSGMLGKAKRMMLGWGKMVWGQKNYSSDSVFPVPTQAKRVSL